MTEIIHLTESSEEIAAGLNALMPQLTDTAWPLTTERLRQILDAPTRVFVARDGGKIVGTAMVAIVYQLKDTKCWLEDVVVSEDWRGQGIAKRLVHACVEAAREAGARSVNMTSRLDRAAAHGLYESMGFKQRETTIYRLPLTDSVL